MRRVGLAGLGIAAGCLLLLILLSQMGVVQFGPCGPDPFGLVLLLGFLVIGCGGVVITVGGLLQLGFRKFRH